MRKPLFVLIAAMLIASTAAHAQNSGHLRYKWRDGKGLAHYSDSLTAEAMKYGYDLVNDRGMSVGHVERQLSPQERAAAQQAALKQATAKRLADERAHADQQLLATYPDEASLKLSQKQALEAIDTQMNTTRVNLRSQEKALADLLSRAGELERTKTPVPKSLADSIASQRDVVNGQRARLDHQQTLRQQAEQQSLVQLQHYRELQAAASPR